MAPHSSTLAWKIPWTEEPGGLQSMGSLGVGHDWATSLSLFTFMHWRRKWQPTPVFLPGESLGWGAWWAAVYEVHRVGHDWSDLAAAAAVFWYRPQVIFSPYSGLAVSKLSYMQLFPCTVLSAYRVLLCDYFSFHSSEEVGVKGLTQGHTTAKWLMWDLKSLSIYHFVFPFHVHYFSLTAVALVINILSPVTQWETNWNGRNISCDVQMGWVICDDEWWNPLTSSGKLCKSRVGYILEDIWEIQLHLHCHF